MASPPLGEQQQCEGCVCREVRQHFAGSENQADYLTLSGFFGIMGKATMGSLSPLAAQLARNVPTGLGLLGSSKT